MLPLANHPGDWLISIAYAAPALIVVGLLIVTVMKQKLRDRSELDASEDAASEES